VYQVKAPVMTATAAPKVKDQVLIPHGLVESASVNSFADFGSSNLNEMKANKEKEVNDFINTFICHLIFYAVFCFSLVLHILIDLGLGSFVKNQFLKFIEIAKNTFDVNIPAFA
tara:strand:- start:220 stop:561 length:342 start_codon:yes stop_codon:yes gene_type:complete